MEEWKIYRLGDLVDFQNGYAFKSSKFLYDGKYKIIRIKELKNGLVKFFEDTVSISDEPNEILSKILVNKGDVIFALTGDPVSKQNANSWVGRVSLYTHDIPAYLNQRTCKIIQCNNVVPQYVYYYFRQYENLYSLASKATGSASQANISTKILEDTEILLPSLSVQKKMVAILASLDNKIALNRRINVLLGGLDVFLCLLCSVGSKYLVNNHLRAPAFMVVLYLATVGRHSRSHNVQVSVVCIVMRIDEPGLSGFGIPHFLQILVREIK